MSRSAITNRASSGGRVLCDPSYRGTTTTGGSQRLMDCPNCGSSQVQTLAMVISSGTTHVDATSRSTFSGVSSSVTGGAQSVSSGTGQGWTRTKGTSTTSLAQRAAPPRQARSSGGKIFFLTLVVSVGGGLAVGLALNDSKLGAGLATLVFFVAIVAGVLWFIASKRKARKYNRGVFPTLLASWRRSWMCLACGRIFEARADTGPQLPPPPPPPPQALTGGLFCHQCGRGLVPGARFCSYCSAPAAT